MDEQVFMILKKRKINLEFYSSVFYSNLDLCIIISLFILYILSQQYFLKHLPENFFIIRINNNYVISQNKK